MAHINYLKLSCFLHYPLTVWNHISTGCSQRVKVTFGNTLCTFKTSEMSHQMSSSQVHVLHIGCTCRSSPKSVGDMGVGVGRGGGGGGGGAWSRGGGGSAWHVTHVPC